MLAGRISGAALGIAPTTIYVSAGTVLSAIRLDGKQEWTFQTGKPLRMRQGDGSWLYFSSVSGPAVAEDGTVYIGSGEGKLYAVSPEGAKKWETGGVSAPINSMPSVGPGKDIYFTSGDGFLRASTSGGRIRWEYRIERRKPARPNLPATSDYWGFRGVPAVSYEGVIYVSSWSEGTVYAIDPRGRLLWSTRLPMVGRNQRGAGELALADDGTVYVGGKGLFALDSQGRKKWSFGEELGRLSPPIVDVDSTVYFRRDRDKTLYAISSTGKEKWTVDARRIRPAAYFGATLALGADGALYCGGAAFNDGDD